MNELSLQQDEKIKEVSVADGYVYIDLLCGLRLSAPIVHLAEGAHGGTAGGGCAPVPDLEGPPLPSAWH